MIDRPISNTTFQEDDGWDKSRAKPDEDFSYKGPISAGLITYTVAFNIKQPRKGWQGRLDALLFVVGWHSNIPHTKVLYKFSVDSSSPVALSVKDGAGLTLDVVHIAPVDSEDYEEGECDDV